MDSEDLAMVMFGNDFEMPVHFECFETIQKLDRHFLHNKFIELIEEYSASKIFYLDFEDKKQVPIRLGLTLYNEFHEGKRDMFQVDLINIFNQDLSFYVPYYKQFVRSNGELGGLVPSGKLITKHKDFDSLVAAKTQNIIKLFKEFDAFCDESEIPMWYRYEVFHAIEFPDKKYCPAEHMVIVPGNLPASN